MKRISGSSLFLSIWRTSHEVLRADLESIRAAGFNSRSDFAVMEILLHKGPQPVNTIGRQVLLTSGSITTAIHRLEKLGWVERQGDAADKRRAVVHLTPAGRERIESAFAEHALRLETLFSGLSDAETRTALRLLKKIRRSD